MAARILILVCFWLINVPLGYVLVRQDMRIPGCTWTRIDRLGAIVAAVFCGPMILIGVPAGFLINKLVKSKWGRQEAKW